MYLASAFKTVFCLKTGNPVTTNLNQDGGKSNKNNWSRPICVIEWLLKESCDVTWLQNQSASPKKQAAATLESIVKPAIKNARNTFTLPGLGKLVLVHRKARTTVKFTRQRDSPMLTGTRGCGRSQY